MRILDVPPNTRVFLGAPAKSFSAARATELAGALYAMSEVEEVHLLHCFALGVMESPATVLVVVMRTTTPVPRVARRIGRQLSRQVGELELDLWPLAFDSPFAGAVRQANSKLERDPFAFPLFKKPKRWWRMLSLG
jgi:hypothetical protein